MEEEKHKAPVYRRMDWSASTEINVNSPTGKPLGEGRGVVEFMRSEFRK
jgi:hypothetical protein